MDRRRAESETEAARHNLADALAGHRRALNARPKPPGDSAASERTSWAPLTPHRSHHVTVYAKYTPKRPNRGTKRLVRMHLAEIL